MRQLKDFYRASKWSLCAAFLVAASTGCAASNRGDQTAQAATSAVEQGDVLLQKGKDALRRGDTTRAEQYLAMALEKGAPERETVMLLIRTCLSRSRVRSALNYAEPFLQDHPEEHALRYLVATLHVGMGHPEEANRQLALLIFKEPGYADAYFLRGVVALQDGRTAVAESSLSRYLALNEHGDFAAEARSHLDDLQLAKNDAQDRQVHVPRPSAGPSAGSEGPSPAPELSTAPLKDVLQ